jgi:large-conductance mechanosensitive channel
MANRPQTPTQTSLVVLRELIFRDGASEWAVIMLVLSIPIAFGVTLSNFLTTLTDTFIQPFLSMFIGPLRSWMIPLGGVNYLNGIEVANGIYFGEFLMEVLRFIMRIGVLFLFGKVLKGIADRTD